MHVVYFKVHKTISKMILMLHFTVDTRVFCGIAQKGNKIAAESQKSYFFFLNLRVVKTRKPVGFDTPDTGTYSSSSPSTVILNFS